MTSAMTTGSKKKSKTKVFINTTISKHGSPTYLNLMPKKQGLWLLTNHARQLIFKLTETGYLSIIDRLDSQLNLASVASKK